MAAFALWTGRLPTTRQTLAQASRDTSPVHFWCMFAFYIVAGVVLIVRAFKRADDI
jgi:hypothetical protein